MPSLFLSWMIFGFSTYQGDLFFDCNAEQRYILISNTNCYSKGNSF